MSILLAESMTPRPALHNAALPATGPVDSSQTLIVICLVWAIAALMVAFFLGAFKRKSVAGPSRLMADESAWDLVFILFASFFAGCFANLLLVSLDHHATGARILLLGAVADIATFVTIVILLIVRGGSGLLARIGLNPRRIRTGIAGGGTTLFVLYPLIQLTSAVVESTFNFFHLTKAKPHEILQFLSNTQDHRLTAFAIFLAVVIAPFTEELFYRGLLQTSLTRVFGWMYRQTTAQELGPMIAGPDDSLALSCGSLVSSAVVSTGPGVRWMGIVASSAVFAAIHVEPAFLAPIFVLALGLGYAYERTGNLWLTITAHALFNTAQIVLYLAFGH